jgi:hypothetical protein
LLKDCGKPLIWYIKANWEEEIPFEGLYTLYPKIAELKIFFH